MSQFREAMRLGYGVNDGVKKHWHVLHIVVSGALLPQAGKVFCLKCMVSFGEQPSSI